MNQPSHAHAPTKRNIRAVANAVDALLPDPEDMTKAMQLQKLCVMVGCCMEIPVIRPSYPEIGEVIGISHTTAMRHLELWHLMPWRDRYAWLVLVEGRLALEKNPLDAAVLR